MILSFKDLEQKPMNKLNPAELRAFNTCKGYPTDELKNACFKGFRKGALFVAEYLKEIKENLR